MAGGMTSWLFISAAEKLNTGLPRTTSAGGQSGILTWDLKISLSHVASDFQFHRKFVLV